MQHGTPRVHVVERGVQVVHAQPAHVPGFVEALNHNVGVGFDGVEQVLRWHFVEVDLAVLERSQCCALVGNVFVNHTVELHHLAARKA